MKPSSRVRCIAAPAGAALRRVSRAIAAATPLLLLAGCGGGEEPQSADGGVRPLAAVGDRLGGGRSARPSAATLHERFASQQRAIALEQALGPETLRVHVACCGSAEVEAGVNLVWGLQAAADASDDVPVVVSGDDAATAAAVVDRLTRAGLTQVALALE